LEEVEVAWIHKRVWQMGLGALLVLIGALLAYQSAASEPINSALMWVGLGLIFIGLLAPLITRFIERDQEKQGERGEN
jgi:uncharacterized membrane protein